MRAFQALALALGISLLACTGDGDDGQAKGPLGVEEIARLESERVPFVRFQSPRGGETLSGEAPIELALFAPDDVLEVAFGVEGETLSPLRGGLTAIGLYTPFYDDGEHELVARMTSESGETWEDRIRVAFDNPDHRLLSLEVPELEYANGDELVLSPVYSTAGLALELDLSSLDSGFSADALAVEDLGEGNYRISHSITADNGRPDGVVSVSITATDENGEAVVDEARIRLRNDPEIPVVLQGAYYVEGQAPPLSDSSGRAPTVTAVQGAGGTLLRGGTAELEVAWDQDPAQPADKLLFRLEGFSGYYVLPLPAAEEGADSGQATLRLSLPPFAPGFDDGALGIGIGILDGLGQAVDWVSETITGISVGSDGVQVGVTWDADVDLDLSVTDPEGRLIDFEAPSQGEGALDLDSNALCAIDGVNAENISWQPGEELQGIYQVRVNLFDSCGVDFVSWRVTARFCGRTEVFTGTFTDADVDTSGAGEVVTEFTVDCNQVVRGTVIREKINDVKRPGVRELDVVPFAPIRVRSADGITTLAQGVTDQRGRYDLRFGNLDQQDFQVEVEASWVDPTTNEVRARVAEMDGSIAHRFSTGVLAGTDSIVRDVNPRIRVPDGAGAWNVLDAIRRGYSWVATNAGSSEAASLAPMTGHFSEGAATPINNSFQRGEELFIQGTADIPHQWSDSVNMHELMHFVVRELSFSPLPGGPHTFHGKADPHLSWSEGLATAFAQDALGRSDYVDQRPAVVTRIDLERGLPVLRGTSDNTTSGLVNEFLVSMVLWDLFDGANEAHDGIQERQFSFIATFDRSPADRNGNRLDLSDFLDQLRQDFPGNPDARLKCLTDEVAYPYDYPSSVTCSP